MSEKLTPTQRLANGYAAQQSNPSAARVRASLASNYREGQAEELTAAATKLPGRGLLRIQAGYAQNAQAAHEAGQE